ncbi:hypothetical protein GCM10027615_10490 [Plantactinospora veratri]
MKGPASPGYAPALDGTMWHIYLATLLQAAIEDLHRLNPDTAPDPARMYARFLGWVRPRLLITRARRLRHLYGI